MATPHAPMLGGGPAKKPYVLMQSAIGVLATVAVTYLLGSYLVEVDKQHHTFVQFAFPFLGIASILAATPFLFYAFYSDQFATTRGLGGPLFSLRDYALILRRVLAALAQANNGGKIRSKDL
mmetsp:Transcript_10096/g.27509  ORF Transcript_10096/g.27509 Transcript_10096/m.27509 type:complete len:122 (-) Transcript_10096:22-387(-)